MRELQVRKTEYIRQNDNEHGSYHFPGEIASEQSHKVPLFRSRAVPERDGESTRILGEQTSPRDNDSH